MYNLLKLFYSYCFLFIFFLNCSDKKNDLKNLGSSKFYIPLKGNDTNNIKEFNEIFYDPDLLYLKTPDSLFIASVTKLIIYKKRFFVLDKKFSNLICFDEKGSFLLEYGKIGLSNNEFRAIQDFDIDTVRNQVIIFSNDDLSLYYYSLDKGTFIKKTYIGLYANSIAVLPSNQIILYTSYKLNRKVLGYNIIILDSNAHVINKFLPFDINLSTYGWLFTGFLNRSNNQAFFSDAFNDSVFSYQGQSFSLFSYIDINSDSIQKIKFDHQRVLSSKIILDSATSFLKDRFFKNDNYIIFNYQFEKRTKIAIYKIEGKNFHILTAKNASDPLLILTRNLLYLDSNNTCVFAISPDDILSLKQKTPILYAKLPENIKNKLKNTDSISNFYFLIAQLKK